MEYYSSLILKKEGTSETSDNMDEDIYAKWNICQSQVWFYL